ncbi:MAG: response regulator transcription factor [Bacteroidota bacterium]
MNNTIKVMIADNHEIIRIGIKKLLEKNGELEIVAVADKEEEILMKIKKHRPDVVIMDNNFENINSLNVAEYTTKNYPGCKIIMHPSILDEISIMSEIKAGISGFVPKDMSTANLIDAVRTVHKGDKFLKGNIADIFVNNFFKEKKKTEIIKKIQQVLSKKEIEILKLTGEGLSIKQIAEKSFISIRTVQTHRSNIKKKLRIHNTAELVKYAIKNNVITV